MMFLVIPLRALEERDPDIFFFLGAREACVAVKGSVKV